MNNNRRQQQRPSRTGGLVRALGVGMLAVVMSVGGWMTTAQAQDAKGTPPKPGEELPRPLEVKRDLTPKIPAEFDKPRPNYHEVRPGDTLFDISSYYFGTPYVWPVLWSFNDHITNPHWIYPGDIIYLRYVPPKPPCTPGEDCTGRPQEGLSVAMGGFFLDNDDYNSVGVIEYSPETKTMLAFPDKVYINLNDDERDKRKKGDVYAIIRFMNDVTDDENDDKLLARKYKIIGAVRITSEGADGILDTAVVVQSWEEIYRGDALFPYERQLLRVGPVIAGNTVVGDIADTLRVVTLFGEHNYVFINRGKNQGVRVGNRFFAYDRQDGLSGLDSDNAASLPYERVAQIRVIRTDNDWSTALVMESLYELERGMRVEMYKDY